MEITIILIALTAIGLVCDGAAGDAATKTLGSLLAAFGIAGLLAKLITLVVF